MQRFSPYEKDGRDNEPGDQWKTELRQLIDECLQPVVKAAKNKLAQQIGQLGISDEDHHRCTDDYTHTRRYVRKLGEEIYEEELDLRRKERRWGVEASEGPQVLHQVQLGITERIRRRIMEEGTSGGPSITTGPIDESERRPTFMASKTTIMHTEERTKSRHQSPVPVRNWYSEGDIVQKNVKESLPARSARLYTDRRPVEKRSVASLTGSSSRTLGSPQPMPLPTSHRDRPRELRAHESDARRVQPRRLSSTSSSFSDNDAVRRSWKYTSPHTASPLSTSHSPVISPSTPLSTSRFSKLSRDILLLDDEYADEVGGSRVHERGLPLEGEPHDSYSNSPFRRRADDVHSQYVRSSPEIKPISIPRHSPNLVNSKITRWREKLIGDHHSPSTPSEYSPRSGSISERNSVRSSPRSVSTLWKSSLSPEETTSTSRLYVAQAGRYSTPASNQSPKSRYTSDSTAPSSLNEDELPYARQLARRTSESRLLVPRARASFPPLDRKPDPGAERWAGIDDEQTVQLGLQSRNSSMESQSGSVAEGVSLRSSSDCTLAFQRKRIITPGDKAATSTANAAASGSQDNTANLQSNKPVRGRASGNSEPAWERLVNIFASTPSRLTLERKQLPGTDKRLGATSERNSVVPLTKPISEFEDNFVNHDTLQSRSHGAPRAPPLSRRPSLRFSTSYSALGSLGNLPNEEYDQEASYDDPHEHQELEDNTSDSITSQHSSIKRGGDECGGQPPSAFAHGLHSTPFTTNEYLGYVYNQVLSSVFPEEKEEGEEGTCDYLKEVPERLSETSDSYSVMVEGSDSEDDENGWDEENLNEDNLSTSDRWAELRGETDHQNHSLDQNLDSSIFREITADSCAIFRTVFSDKEKYKRLLSLDERSVQSVLDVMQTILDHAIVHWSDSKSERILLKAMLRLSKQFGLYPSSYTLTGIERDAYPIASGYFGEIFKGEINGRKLALKVFKLYANERDKINDMFKGFYKEAILWRYLTHPNLLPFYGIYQLGDTGGRICLVSPWISNGNICQYLQRNHQANRLHLVMDIAEGIAYLHGKSIVHGDLKGANVLVSDGGTACLADFGLSSVYADNTSSFISGTNNSSMAGSKGTLRWQAPELIGLEDCPSVKTSTSSDIFAFACVCYEIFVGKIPFYEINHDVTVMIRVLKGQRPLRPESNSTERKFGLTDWTWTLMEECWDQNPSKRPTIFDVVDRLSSRDEFLRQGDKGDDNWGDLKPNVFRSSLSKDDPQVSETNIRNVLSLLRAF